MNDNQTLNVFFSLTDVALLVLLVILAMYIIYSVIFYYHWDKYAVDGKVKDITISLYFLSTVSLLIIMGLSALLV